MALGPSQTGRWRLRGACLRTAWRIGGWWAFRSSLGTPPGSCSFNEEEDCVGDGVRGVPESKVGEVDCHPVQPVGHCTTAAASLELVRPGWLGYWLYSLLCAELLHGTGDQKASSSPILACMATGSIRKDLTKLTSVSYGAPPGRGGVQSKESPSCAPRSRVHQVPKTSTADLSPTGFPLIYALKL